MSSGLHWGLQPMQIQVHSVPDSRRRLFSSISAADLKMDRGQLELLNLALELKTANMRLTVLVDRYLKMTRKRKARTV